MYSTPSRSRQRIRTSAPVGLARGGRRSSELARSGRLAMVEIDEARYRMKRDHRMTIRPSRMTNRFSRNMPGMAIAEIEYAPRGSLGGSDEPDCHDMADRLIAHGHGELARQRRADGRARPTGSSGWASGRASSAGARAARAKANLVAVAGPPEPDGLILSGHLDIVPFADQPGWTRDPLRLAFDGDRVYGRGTSRHEGASWRSAWTRPRARPRARSRRPLVFVFTADEEIGCLGAARLAPELDALLGGDSEAGARLDRRADLVAGLPRAQGHRRVRRHACAGAAATAACRARA